MAGAGRGFVIDAAWLRRMAARDPELRSALELGFSQDVRSKIVRNNAAVRKMIADEA